jgi:hypothetical protein
MSLSKPAAATAALFIAFNASSALAQEKTLPLTDLGQAAKAYCVNPENLWDEHAPLDIQTPSWTEKIELSTLSIGCLLTWQDEGVNVQPELKEKIKKLQGILLDYAMNHDFELMDGSLDGVIGPLTTGDYIDIAGYVGFQEVFVSNRYDPLSHTTEYLQRFAQEMMKHQPEYLKERIREIQESYNTTRCTGQPFGYDGICGASSARRKGFEKTYG